MLLELARRHRTPVQRDSLPPHTHSRAREDPEFDTLLAASARMAETSIVNGNASHALPGGPEDLLALVDERLPPVPCRPQATGPVKSTPVRLWRGATV
jgi:hypothetical protein